MLRGIEELEAKLDAGGNAGNTGFFAMHCENFATIEKISQSLRNFAMHNFSL